MIKDIKPGGHSAIVFVLENNVSYLSNCRYMKINPKLEIKQSEEDCLSLVIKEDKPEDLKSIIQSKHSLRRSLSESNHMTFDLWARVELVQVPARSQDKKDPTFHSRLTGLNE